MNSERDKQQDLTMDPAKPTIMIVSDCAFVHSGLARVTRAIFKRLHATGKYNILQLGWGHAGNITGEEIPWPVYGTKIAPNGGLLEPDRFGQLTFPELFIKFKPNIVLAYGDPWMIEHVGTSHLRSQYKLISYICIDSEPIYHRYHKAFSTADVVVTFGKWPQRVLIESAGLGSEVIPHGVDTDVFRPNREGSSEFRRVLGDTGDKFVIGTVARNQPRKALGVMFILMHALKYGRYAKCKDCGRVTLDKVNPCTRGIRWKADKCMWCRSDNVEHAVPDETWIWYYHGAMDDSAGCDMLTLHERYALGDSMRWNPRVKATMGMPDEILAVAYNAMDIFSMPTTAEGFGCPIMEAMACGVPVILPAYSAYMDWAPAAGIMVEYDEYIEQGVNASRARIRLEDWIRALLAMRDPVTRSKYSTAARAKAEEYKWDDIVPLWDKLFSTALNRQVDGEWLRVTTI